MRKLAHVEKILDIQPIPGADKIEVATVLGWQCVIKKNEFNVGDRVVYIEIDSRLPKDDPEFKFLEPRGFKVKTIKLRQQISQGLVIPLRPGMERLALGTDVTDQLKITKIQDETPEQEQEKPSKFSMFKYNWFRKLFHLLIPKKKKLGWPGHVRKTDETRIQDIPNVPKRNKTLEVYVTEKVDYQSVTFTTYKRKFVICSRNQVTNNKTDLYHQIAEKYNIKKILKENPHITIQGEQGSTRVQGNKYKIQEPTLWVFNIIDHKRDYHFNYEEMKLFCDKYNLQTVPHLMTTTLEKLGTNVQELVEYSKGKSVINPDIPREGVVIRSIQKGKKYISFKVINPDFLLKY